MGVEPNQILDSCSSTQITATESWEKAVARHFDWFCSLEQTRGRGRRGNEWVSNRGNFFFSMILPEPSQERLTWSAMIGALAVTRVLPEYDLSLKWPNDIYFQNGKCGGVIAERVSGALILGIGINLEDSPALKDRRTTKLIPPLSVIELSSRLIPELKNIWTQFTSEDRSVFDSLVHEYKARSLFKSGDPIRWVSGTQELEGSVQGLGVFGELIVKTRSGQNTHLYSEDVFGVTQAESSF